MSDGNNPDRMQAYVTVHEDGISVDVEGMICDAVMVVKANNIPKNALLKLVNDIYDNMQVTVTHTIPKRMIN